MLKQSKQAAASDRTIIKDFLTMLGEARCRHAQCGDTVTSVCCWHLEAVSKPHNGHFRWFSRDDRTRENWALCHSKPTGQATRNTSAVSFKTEF